MEITWLGHSCFKIKGKKVTIITDPYDDSIGYTLGNPKADIVTVSHSHRGHSFVAGVSGSSRVLRGPGEYEVFGVMVTGIKTYHDASKGEDRGKNTVYLIEMEDMRLCHLGDLGHALTAERASELSEIDVLMIPVGGVSTIDSAEAAELVRLLQPKVVIPMHFHTETLGFELEPADKFLKEMGVKADLVAEPRLSISKSSLAEETQVVVLNYRFIV
ncbi:MAG: MBL fold metallo-hydrolase [Chloroflexota bacterium]|nr:MBL fold metallo-hydrolase [Chloroflexota bacterium]